jgi:hypothetical protein
MTCIESNVFIWDQNQKRLHFLILINKSSHYYNDLHNLMQSFAINYCSFCFSHTFFSNKSNAHKTTENIESSLTTQWILWPTDPTVKQLIALLLLSGTSYLFSSTVLLILVSYWALLSTKQVPSFCLERSFITKNPEQWSHSKNFNFVLSRFMNFDES